MTREEAVRITLETAKAPMTLGDIEREAGVRYARPIVEDLLARGLVLKVRQGNHARWTWRT